MSDAYLRRARLAKKLKGYCCYWDHGPLKKWMKRNRKNKQARRVQKNLTRKEMNEG